LLLIGLSKAPPPPSFSPAFLQGTHVFRRILQDVGFQALVDKELLFNQPGQKILIVHGNPGNALPGYAGLLKWFVANGGAMLVASDQEITSLSLTADLELLANVAIKGELVRCLLDPPSRYRDNEFCPLLRPLPAGEEFFRSNLRVATNLPSWLKVKEGGLPEGIKRLAELPDGCGLYRESPTGVTYRGYPRWLSKDDRLFAVGGEVGQGRLLVLADHSLFINAMMMPTDNNNVEFTYNCLNYLRTSAGEVRRTQVLFLEEGKVINSFNVPLKDVPGLPPGALNALLAKVADHLAELEEPRPELDGQNVFDHSIVSWWWQHHVGPRHVITGAIVLLTLALLAYGCLRLVRAHGFRPEPTVPLAAEASAAVAPTAALLDQRQQALLQLGNLWESGRALARQVFASAGGVDEPPGLSGGTGPPRIMVRGGDWWQRWRRRRQVARLWRLAFAPTPVRISPGAWPALVAELEQLQVDLAHGVVQVGTEA
jgi:hypothetical protein